MPKITEEMIHPELRKIGRKQRGSKTFSLRKAKLMKVACRLLKGKHSKSLSYTQEFVTREDGSKLRLCVYTPLTVQEQVPGLLWIHGGGYILGVPEQDDLYIKRFIKATGCVVVSPDYTLALDKPYPAAVNDCYLALLWLKEHGHRYGMDKNQIFIGGNSAGGGLSVATTLMAREKGQVNIAFQMPLYPMLEDRPTASNTDNDAPVWDSVSNDAAWKLYLGDLSGSDSVPIYAAPGRNTDFSNLPPACFFVGDVDPFLEESSAYAKGLKDAGIEVNYKVFKGGFHAFERMATNTTIAQEALQFMVDGLVYAKEHYYK